MAIEVAMQTGAPVRQHSRIESELTTAAAFVAALSRFPNSPGEPFTADASFAPLSEFDMVTAANLPAGTTSLLDRDDPGWAWTT